VPERLGWRSSIVPIASREPALRCWSAVELVARAASDLVVALMQRLPVLPIGYFSAFGAAHERAGMPSKLYVRAYRCYICVAVLSMTPISN